MARANVTVVIDDQSYVIPGSESGSLTRAGFPSQYRLINVVGNTADRKRGYMQIGSLGEWLQRLTNSEPIASGETPDGNYHTTNVAGGTGSRWPYGPTGDWKNEWWACHNYLQYGGVLVVGGTGEDYNTTSGYNTLKDKQIPLDVVFGVTADQSSVSTIASVRGDCIAVIPDATYGLDADSATFSGTQDEFNISVFGMKKHLNVNRNMNQNTQEGLNSFIETNCAADVAGCIARTDRLSDPWISPAGFKRGRILDVVSLIDNPTDSQMDTMYGNKINPIVTFPGEGTVLFGDKTGASGTSTLSRINVSRLFIYLKKHVGAAARSILFELNDATTRASFVNATNGLMENIRSRRGVYDYKIVCDESNNTGTVVDANQFVADIFVKPTKSVNFIKITFTNKNTSDTLT